MVDFKFPDVGEGIQEGEIVKWLVSDGDTVKENQNIVQVETDKSVVDLPSPASGTISNISKKEGDTVNVGEVLCSIGGSGGGKKSKAASEPAEEELEEKPSKRKTKSAEPAKEVVKPKKRGLAVVGELEEAPEDDEIQEKPSVKKTKSKEIIPEEVSEKKPTSKNVSSEKGFSVVGEIGDDSEERRPQAATMKGEVQSSHVKTTPVVRRLAAENNINLSKIKGTGPDGRILKKDLPVSGSVNQQNVPVMKGATPHGPAERIPLKGIRKAISRNLTISNSIPQVTTMEDVDITKLWRIKDKEKQRITDAKITLLPFVVKAAIAVLKENPYFNASLDEKEESIIVKKYYNIGIAVETPVGLMVPVVRNADKMSIVDISKQIHSLASKARDRKIGVEEMKGGTFTITNYGSIGGTYATPLINPPESAILGVGRVFERVNPKNPSKVSKILPISLTFDHRIIDGAQAARFVETLKSYLEDPNHLFMEL